MLCDYSTEFGAFRSVACGLLERIPVRSDRVSFPYDGNLYSFVVEAGFSACGNVARLLHTTNPVFGVVGVEAKKQLAFGFLEKVKGEFLKEYGSRALDAGPGSLESSFGCVLT